MGHGEKLTPRVNILPEHFHNNKPIIGILDILENFVLCRIKYANTFLFIFFWPKMVIN